MELKFSAPTFYFKTHRMTRLPLRHEVEGEGRGEVALRVQRATHFGFRKCILAIILTNVAIRASFN
jgi:hypothetical protein